MTKEVGKNWVSRTTSSMRDCNFNRMLASTVQYANAMQLTYWRITFCKTAGRYQVDRSRRTMVTFIICTALALSYAVQIGYRRMASDDFTISAIWLNLVQHIWWIVYQIVALAGICMNAGALAELLTIGERLDSRLDLHKRHQQSLYSKSIPVQRIFLSFLVVGFYSLFYSETRLEDFWHPETGSLASHLFFDICLFWSNIQDAGLKGVTLSVCYRAWYQVTTCKSALTSGPIGNIEVLLDSVDDLMEILDNLNSVFGFVVLSCTLGMVPFYSVYLPQIIKGDVYLKITYSMYAVALIVTAFLCGGTHQTMSEMPETIKRHLKSGIYVSEAASQRLQITLQQLQSGVGIKAKVFVITWGWIGQVAGAVITFAMILVQIQT